jgi:hypothetical protein
MLSERDFLKNNCKNQAPDSLGQLKGEKNENNKHDRQNNIGNRGRAIYSGTDTISSNDGHVSCLCNLCAGRANKMKVKIIKKSTRRHMCNMHSADLTAAIMKELADLGYKAA